MGYALGRIGLSYDDFCRLLPEEFEQIGKAYSERCAEENRMEWERMRVLATITIQPHVKGKMTPQKLLPFPWEKNKGQEGKKPVSKEEGRARLEALVKRIGLQSKPGVVVDNPLIITAREAEEHKGDR